ncbi:MAG: efflux RND transporter periplasmic adaptor subunit [Thermoanaerobaculia bacterium]
MKRILLIVLGLAMLVLFVGTLAFLYQRSRVQPMVFQAREPFVTDIVNKAVATGSVMPREEVAIKPRISGIIDEVHVEPGERVEEGDLIVRIRIVPDMLNLSNADARLSEARIRLQQADRDLGRNRALFEQGLIPESSLNELETAYETARAEVEAAEDSLAVIQEGARKGGAQTANTLVRATISGMALEVPVEVGNSVIEVNNFNEGTTLATIANMDEMVFEGYVDESEVGKLETGMDLELTVGALEDQRFQATLEYIAPKGVEEEEEGGAIQFEIRAATRLEQGIFLRANYSATADVILDRREGVLAIEESWLQFDGGQPFVEVPTADGGWERRDVEVGLSDGLNIEVVSGLSRDDRVKDPTSGRPPGTAPEEAQQAGGRRQRA